MKKDRSRSDSSSQSHNLALSKSALSDFLDQLAALYRSREFGNLSLATALRELAKEVRRSAPLEKLETGSSVKRASTRSGNELQLLRELDLQSVQRFLADQGKSKTELLELAAERFSIPRSQLKRMKIADVRQVINSAMLHESSIEIIAEESKRDGSARTS
jgi:hypothetical protein